MPQQRLELSKPPKQSKVVEKVRCEPCGQEVIKSSLPKHNQTKKHKENTGVVEDQQPSSSKGNQRKRPRLADDPPVAPEDNTFHMDNHFVDLDNRIEYIHDIDEQYRRIEAEDDDNSSIIDEEYISDDDSDSNNDSESNDYAEDFQPTQLVTEYLTDRFRTITTSTSEDQFDNLEAIANEDVERLGGMTSNWGTSCESKWDHNVQEDYPFKNLQTFVMHALVNGDDDQLSRRQLKKLLYAMNLILKLKDNASEEQRSFNLPKLDNLWNYQTRKRNEIPLKETVMKEVTVKVKNPRTEEEEDVQRKVYLNLPSEHLKHLIANPKKSKLLSLLPDETPNQSIGLHQGKKWKEHASFQHPMVVERGRNYWVGDVFIEQDNTIRLLKRFYTIKQVVYAEVYRGMKHSGFFGFETNTTEVPLSVIAGNLVNQSDLRSNCVTFGNDNNGLDEVHRTLLFDKHPLKINKRDNNGNAIEGQFYKVKVAPIALFSDDYSGNMSKQHNPYESWSMTCAAMPFEIRSKRENTFFIWTAPKTDGVNFITVIPFIVDDLKCMENGKLMYSAEENEMVIVTAPIMFILADNPAHSDLCGILGLRTVYPCRKCYYRQVVKPNSTNYTLPISAVIGPNNYRTKEDYRIASSDPNSMIYNAVNFTVTAKTLSYRNLGTERLLELNSYDPAQDTPVEILHTVLLGVAKYLVNHLINVTLKNKTAQMNKLIAAVKRYETCKSYQRSFSRQLKHCGSFLGRDYKQLLQILPHIISKEFPPTTANADITLMNQSLARLGFLCSLLFVRRIKRNFLTYVQSVDEAAMYLIAEMHNFDVTTTNLAPYCGKPKTHLLRHLKDDLIRFGCALHFETEKGEQFNKFLREHLFHTNRKTTSRDLAVKFGKQEMIRHVIDGGSWINKDGRRVKFGKNMESYMVSLGDSFFKEMFGEAREFADNNCVGLRNLVKGVCGVFQYEDEFNDTKMFVGEVVDVSSEKTVFQKYYISLLNGTYCCFKSDLLEISSDNRFVSVGIIDMFLKGPTGDPIINMYKFGTVELLNENYAKLTN